MHIRHWRFRRNLPTITGILLLFVALAGIVTPAPALAAPQWSTTGLAEHEIHALAIDPRNPAVIYAAAGDVSIGAGLLKSSNSGATWSNTKSNIYPKTVAIDPSNSQIIYAGNAYGVEKTTDGGANWLTLPSIGAAGHRAIVIAPAAPRTVYVGVEHGWGVFKSVNGGADWSNPLTSRYVTSLAIDPFNPQMLLAGTQDYYQTRGGVMRSANGGVNWTQVTTNTQVNAVAFDPLSPGVVYAATQDAGMLKSTDGGLTWAAANGGLTTEIVLAVAVDPQRSGVVYAGTWEAGVFQSLDGGASWSAINAGLNKRYVLSLAIDPTDSNTIYAGTLGGGVYRLTGAAGYAVSGRVRDANGNPLTGVVVSDGAGHSATTGVDGIYTIEALPAGVYTLRAAQSGYSFTPSSRSFTLPPAAIGVDFSGAPGASSWTFILYLAGDNNLESYLKRAITDLEALPPNPYVWVVVLFDGRKSGDTRRFVVQPGGRYTEGVNQWSQGELNMGDPETLRAFIAWARDTYPAQHTYLAIADHGRGTSGVAWDDTSSKDYLTVADLRQALGAVTGGRGKIDLLHYDVCLMAMIEQGYEAQDYADYMVASQNLGWSAFSYARYVQAVDGTTTPRGLAERVAQIYFDDPLLAGEPRTISAVDLRLVNQVRAATDGLAAALRGGMAGLRDKVRGARESAQKFDSREYYRIDSEDEYIDLYDFTLKLRSTVQQDAVQQSAQRLLEAIDAYVVVERHQGGKWNLDNAHGVAIYFPPRPGSDDYERYQNEGLFRFTNDSQWDDLLNDVFAVGVLPEEPGDPGRPPTLETGFRVYLPGVTAPPGR